MKKSANAGGRLRGEGGSGELIPAGGNKNPRGGDLVQSTRFRIRKTRGKEILIYCKAVLGYLLPTGKKKPSMGGEVRDTRKRSRKVQRGPRAFLSQLPKTYQFPEKR